MSYLWVEHRKDGTTHVERRGLAGNESVAPPKRTRGRASQDGYWQKSSTNGVCGGEAIKRRAMALDAQLGVPIAYETTGCGTYLACFKDGPQKRAWLKAHKRVDLDAGYRDPCPGDFRGQYPMEGE
jgi:hypothetical protein